MKASNMSDPLNFKMTPGLTLGMGHPVTTRIRRLNMRNNTIARLGTLALILGGLGLSSAAISSAGTQTQPLETAVNSALKLTHTRADEVAVEKIVTLEGTPAMREESAVRRAGLKPMRLRFSPKYTPEQADKIRKHREATITSNDSIADIVPLNKISKNRLYKNRFELNIDKSGHGVMQISLGHGGWPDFPLGNENWLKRDLSSQMQAGLAKAIKRCSTESAPIYFPAIITKGDTDISKGNFEVECTPGVPDTRNQVTRKQLALAYLNSDELPLKERQVRIQWLMKYALITEFVKSDKTPTFAGDAKACERIENEMLTVYAVTERHRKMATNSLKKCSNMNYDWVRKREGLPLVTAQ